MFDGPGGFALGLREALANHADDLRRGQQARRVEAEQQPSGPNPPVMTCPSDLGPSALGEQQLHDSAVVVVRRELHEARACRVERDTLRMLPGNLDEPRDVG